MSEALNPDGPNHLEFGSKFTEFDADQTGRCSHQQEARPVDARHKFGASTNNDPCCSEDSVNNHNPLQGPLNKDLLCKMFAIWTPQVSLLLCDLTNHGNR